MPFWTSVLTRHLEHCHSRIVLQMMCLIYHPNIQSIMILCIIRTPIHQSSKPPNQFVSGWLTQSKNISTVAMFVPIRPLRCDSELIVQVSAFTWHWVHTLRLFLSVKLSLHHSHCAMSFTCLQLSVMVHFTPPKPCYWIRIQAGVIMLTQSALRLWWISLVLHF